MEPDDDFFDGWRRPGPRPPGGIEPEDGETLDYICGHYRIFQYRRGHRYSVDDVLTAWYGVTTAPRIERALDLGSGIGSVALVVAWKCPAASFTTIEAQEESIRLARKSVRYDGLENRFTLMEGDFRDTEIDGTFDLVLGSPPYFPPGSVSAAAHRQAIPARIEMRGTIADYARVAAARLAPGGTFVTIFPTRELERVLDAMASASLHVVRRREVFLREGGEYTLTLFSAMRRGDLPPAAGSCLEAPLLLRDGEGNMTSDYSAIRLSLGFPPWIDRSSEGR